MTQTFINGKIFVGDTEDHFVNSMVVEDGTVKRIGDNLPNEGEVIDLQGQTVLPGLIEFVIPILNISLMPSMVLLVLRQMLIVSRKCKKHFAILPHMVKAKMYGLKVGVLMGAKLAEHRSLAVMI